MTTIGKNIILVDGVEYAPVGKRGRPHSGRNSATVLFHLPRELKQRAQERARSQYQTLSAFIVQALVSRLNRK